MWVIKSIINAAVKFTESKGKLTLLRYFIDRKTLFFDFFQLYIVDRRSLTPYFVKIPICCLPFLFQILSNLPSLPTFSLLCFISLLTSPEDDIWHYFLNQFEFPNCVHTTLREIENSVPNVFLLCLPVKNYFAALFYTICASSVESSFTAIISSCVFLCLLAFSLVENFPVRFCLT